MSILQLKSNLFYSQLLPLSAKLITRFKTDSVPEVSLIILPEALLVNKFPDEIEEPEVNTFNVPLFAKSALDKLRDSKSKVPLFAKLDSRAAVSRDRFELFSIIHFDVRFFTWEFPAPPKVIVFVFAASGEVKFSIFKRQFAALLITAFFLLSRFLSDIPATSSGTVKAIHVQKGSKVAAGDAILDIA